MGIGPYLFAQDKLNRTEHAEGGMGERRGGGEWEEDRAERGECRALVGRAGRRRGGRWSCLLLLCCVCLALSQLLGLPLLVKALLTYHRAASAAATARARAREYAALPTSESREGGVLNRSYATMVYGHDSTSVCEALVLGSLLAELDPTTPRAALVSNLSSTGAAELSTLWKLHQLGAANEPSLHHRSKSPLWRLPYDRVFYLDADHVPILSGNLSARRKRFEFAWNTPHPLVAAWELPHPWLSSLRAHPLGADSSCFNAGALILSPNSSVADRMELAEGWMREAQARGESRGVKGQEATDAPQFARCPQGTDQPPANWAVRSFETLPLVQLTPLIPCALARGIEGGDTFHAFTGLTPLRLGQACEPHAVLSGKRRCEFPAELPSHRIFRLFGCAETFHQFGVAWWRQFRQLPRHSQEFCLGRHRPLEDLPHPTPRSRGKPGRR
ncbi:MAG: hypothetical protein SGPRY_012244 [Prymnesium sp.]